jgi:hypothetical protein
LNVVTVFLRCFTDVCYEIDGVDVPTSTPWLNAAMLAPYSSAFFYQQSDFGHPAGAVLPTTIASDFPQNLCCGAGRGDH